ncbi:MULTISPECIES: SIS domain-containing protein [Salinivibrio]|uniref:SIS domain-containing protein n=1 Tax=Salinivibrio costicola TaxID=51367 RepID=A0ABX6K8Q9_SALCS|nr:MULTISPECIES: SIS domain-containing protein [Salinivibrio]ODQ01315.1 XRE family transcriptional regulator [Salinivibrio sp. DV]OOF21129.1 XRE family transcriptional regulator [Salinivibrio sp. IB574]PCE65626.1 XRE family transcriptional regulator [Salinivibrio sp. YCSC6]QCF37343.1 SIS domain-containing protein [Salinivibrio sp. YCSC6]QIR07517.1 SIS domain-containing protein [Salinivibrio costicola]
MSIINKILARRTQLSQQGCLIGDWIIAHPEKAAQLTSQALAKQVGVSQSSIVKFSQKMGYKGYSEFKLALNEEIGRKQVMQSTPMHSDILADDPMTVISQKLVKAKTEAMFQTTNALSYEACHQAVAWLNGARRVQVVGIGSSALTAKDLSFKLLKLGITALCEQDSHVQIAVARTLGVDDVQIVISFSGERKEILVATEAAKEQGAKVIALLGPGRSRIRHIADITFDTIADETKHRSSSIASRTAQNVITDLLFISLVQQRDESARQLISDISSDIKQILS